MELNFSWKENKGQYQAGESLFINRVRLAQYGWNGYRSKDDKGGNTRYSGRINLPQIKQGDIFGDTPENIKAEIEKIVTMWFKEVSNV